MLPEMLPLCSAPGSHYKPDWSWFKTKALFVSLRYVLLYLILMLTNYCDHKCYDYAYGLFYEERMEVTTETFGRDYFIILHNNDMDGIRGILYAQ